ncbi:DUF4156 domain-containing protein [Psychrosphaera aquimarina]|uniref:DUF4156 domain-containing protein n=1 Tax=Psychrosphaera aquimarina TaxID=2044854 RepID=A0ABU3R1C2_9GAMM|nr:DUF4156 domain-containing protein [Psychrosphaera aquimarina]MDU0113277.1 DUF4156 domain-containing protein [Psychrosphaera aquimarina]
MKLFLIITLALTLLSGCAQPLNSNATSVRVTNNPDVVKQCVFKGQVKATSNWGGFAAQGVAQESIYNSLRNEAVKIGGNTVFANPQVGMGGAYALGEAYDCKLVN